MINIALKTEFSFKQCYMPIKDIHKYVINGAVGIADCDNTFGHIPLMKEAKKHGFKPIYGVRLRVSRPENEKHRTGHLYTTFIARTDDGLVELYKLVQRAYNNFFYFPRLFDSDIHNLHNGIINLGEHIHENFFPEIQDRAAYEIIAGFSKRGNAYLANFDQRVGPMHIIPQDYVKIAEECNANIKMADMVKWKGQFDLMDICLKSAKSKNLEMTEEYTTRLNYELELIYQKNYQDYFMIVADMIKFAKKSMLVGPSRGSSAGSLVCYLMGITEVDPIYHKLIFERFIDINRFDLPDIDVDFPDRSRIKVFDYLVSKYGRDNVRSLGAVSRFMPKSAIAECAMAMGIPKYKTDPVKDAIIERSSGDARAAMCINDTFDTTNPGKEFITEYPAMRIAGKIEGHASHATRHAAGIIVSTEPLYNYAGINSRDDILMMDKKDAEAINLLKIDCLGLRTLSIIEDTVKQIKGMRLSDVYNLPLDDRKTFDLFNNMRLSGIFQFEGLALQILTKQMGVNHFNDIAAITALARPGALNSGGASRYVKYHTGQDTPRYFNDIHKEITEETYGVTVYQEEMMEIARRIGRFSWEDVSTLRKAASKSLGDEFFGQYKEKFIEGAKESGLDDSEASDIWNDISHSGSWSFNKAHAVSYGLVSYWTAYFKANYPLEFAVASLNNAKDSDTAIKLLRDMVQNEGIEYDPVNTQRSGLTWSVIDNRLVGGLTNIVGIGDIKADKFIKMRDGKLKPTPQFWKIMEDPKTPYDIIFPCRHHWGKLYQDPKSYGLSRKPDLIESIDGLGDYLIVGCLVDRNLRDLNEYTFLKDRNGEIIEDNHLYLNFTVEDDTGTIMCTINRWKFEELGGRTIAEQGKVGESWYLIKGKIKNQWRKIEVEAIFDLTEQFGSLAD
jgi:DNA polymerase III alpha subunit